MVEKGPFPESGEGTKNENVSGAEVREERLELTSGQTAAAVRVVRFEQFVKRT